MINGQRIACRPQVREVLGSVMQARGRTLAFDVLAERLGSMTAVPSRLIDVALYEIRRIFAATPYSCPIERIRGEGLRWSVVAA
ncbi:helix-turn-helix domain-containing protein [Sphingomonas sp. XXL09]|uniref:helix-turn-helix domain-containing protein n=1 Tax=Sphingomonas sp. XXL09 TaxID=3457787 RepID=UPI00406BD493